MTATCEQDVAAWLLDTLTTMIGWKVYTNCFHLSLKEIGVDSGGVLALSGYIQKELNVTIRPREIIGSESISILVSIIYNSTQVLDA